MFKSSSEFSNTVILATILILALAGFIILNLILYYYKRRKHYLEQAQLKEDFKDTLLQSQLEIQEQTFKRISHELHDNLGLVASLVKINLNTIDLNDTIHAADRLEDSKQLLRQLITDLKSLAVSLNSDNISKVGLFKTVESDVERLNKLGIFQVTLALYCDTSHLNSDQEIIIYRMVQEMINNVIKHSSAKNVSITMAVENNLFKLTLIDDGVGFDKEIQKAGAGSGLTNLERRAKYLNAVINIRSNLGTGTQISIELPL
jgi:signal transduction histidine kinase